jgi:hypothetical protein
MWFVEQLQDVVQLAGRDDDAVFVQLLQQQRLGDLGVMVLVQDVGHQVDAKSSAATAAMPTNHVARAASAVTVWEAACSCPPER